MYSTKTLPSRIRCLQAFESHWRQTRKRSQSSGKFVFAGPRTQIQFPVNHWQVPARVVHPQWTPYRTWDLGLTGSCSMPVPRPLCRLKLSATAWYRVISACNIEGFRTPERAKMLQGRHGKRFQQVQTADLEWRCSRIGRLANSNTKSCWIGAWQHLKMACFAVEFDVYLAGPGEAGRVGSSVPFEGSTDVMIWSEHVIFAQQKLKYCQAPEWVNCGKLWETVGN